MLKDIIERPTGAVAPPGPPQLPSTGSTGFPVAVHRSQRSSAFARSRQQQQAKTDGQGHQIRGAVAEGRAVVEVPTLKSDLEVVGGKGEGDEVRRMVESDNLRRVEMMSNEEREQEVMELKERFGNGITDLMRRRITARGEKTTRSSDVHNVNSQPSSSKQTLDSPIGDVNSPQQILADVSRENWRRVAGMSNEERKGEVQELEERFGVRLMTALRARAEKQSSKGKERAVDPPKTSHPSPIASITKSQLVPEDIAPSAMKEKYFPNVPAEPKKLQWLQPLPTSSSTDTSTRFDLSGNVLSHLAKENLPTHLGLHHHGTSPDLAGYTLQDVLYLCRSTVPSQRITMMGLLAKILSQLRSESYSTQVKQECIEAKAKQAAMDLGVDVLTGLTRGVGVIRAAVDLLFEALGGSTWTWLDSESVLSRDFDPIPASTDSDVGIAAIPFEDVLPRMKELLSVEAGVDAGTAQQLIVILRRAVFISSQMCETICSIIPTIVHQYVGQKLWPPKDDRYPSIDALRLLRDITTSSRACGEELVRQGVYETLLKFVITATWSASDLDDSPADTIIVGQTLALEVLRSYYALGRYGIAASVVTSSSAIWRRLGGWVADTISQESTTTTERQVICAYFDCLTVWTTCAIDPHRTTPEHDITWAQIAALGWAQEVLSITNALIRRQLWKQLAAAMQVLIAWITGAQVNGVRGGEDEKKETLDRLRSVDLCDALLAAKDKWTEETMTPVLAASLQLYGLLISSGELMSSNLISNIRDTTNISSLPLNRSFTHLRYHLLPTSMVGNSPCNWLAEASTLMTDFRIGDEPLALDLLDAILRADWTSSPGMSEQLKRLVHPDGLQLLRPLLQYYILPEVEQIVAPYQPSHIYLKATDTLRSSTTPQKTEEGKVRLAGLPVQSDWMFSPLNELLRSGDSTALSQAPPDWSPGEMEIVLATLILAQLVTRAHSSSSSSDRSYILLNMMKVYMLEHGQQSTPTTSESEVFRETTVSQALEALLVPLLTPPTPSNSLQTTAAPLEVVSTAFLGQGVPFYQFYTDFVALYEAISFSEPLFTQLLLPPLEMSYPSDYRKLLWNDHFTALRGIRTKCKDVPLESERGLRGYFEPLEESNDVLNGYARALLRGWITEERNEFMWRVAVHHLAGFFWTEQAAKNDKSKLTRVGLVGMMLSGGGNLMDRLISWDLPSLGHEHLRDEERSRRTAWQSQM